MNTLGRCPHCGAPITTEIKINGRITVCEYCRSEFVMPQDIFSSIVNYQNQQRVQQQAQEQQRINAINIEIKKKKQENDSIAIRRFFAIMSIMFGGGFFGIPSFICRRPGLGILSFFLTMFLVGIDADFGFGVMIPAVIIPIYSIICIKK